MAKTPSLFPTNLDTNANHAPNEGLQVDRQPRDRFTSRAWDLMESAILALETVLRHIGVTVISAVQWEFLGAMNQGVVIGSVPTFQARPDGTQDNLAPGAYRTIDWQTEIFDIGVNFATPSFTAPVTGKYLLTCCVYLDDVDSVATALVMRLTTTARPYYDKFCPDSLVADDAVTLLISVVADMTAGDTATVEINITGGVAQADVETGSYFSGVLVG